ADAQLLDAADQDPAHRLGITGTRPALGDRDPDVLTQDAHDVIVEPAHRRVETTVVAARQLHEEPDSVGIGGDHIEDLGDAGLDHSAQLGFHAGVTRTALGAAGTPWERVPGIG